MKKSTFVIFVIIFALFGGCRKPVRDIKMHGYFYDPETGTRLSDGTFNFDVEFSDKFSGSTIRRDGSNGTTDANGNYELIIRDAKRNKEVGKQYTGAIHTPYGSSDFEISPDFSVKRDMELNIPVRWKGPFFLILNNVNPYNAQDVIRDFYFSDPDQYFYPLSAYTFTGIISNDTIDMRVESGQRLLHSTIIKNNITTHRVDTVNVYTKTNSYYQLNY